MSIYAAYTDPDHLHVYAGEHTNRIDAKREAEKNMHALEYSGQYYIGIVEGVHIFLGLALCVNAVGMLSGVYVQMIWVGICGVNAHILTISSFCA